MVLLRFALQLQYLVGDPGADFVFNIHAANMPRQRVVNETLQLSPFVASLQETDASTGTRHLRLSTGPGPFTASYQADVEIDHYRGNPFATREVPVRQIPADVLACIYPSRYCESDRLLQFAVREFGPMRQGYARVQAIRDWVLQHTRFSSNSSNSSTSAIDTLLDCKGVCRDFAHLMIALCRALNIPARFVTGIDYGADPALGPTDFHAYVEVYLADDTGARWYLFDPSGTAIPMGFIRIGTGRDAADASFSTIFGPVTSSPPVISIEAIANSAGAVVVPVHCQEALSTSGV